MPQNEPKWAVLHDFGSKYRRNGPDGPVLTRPDLEFDQKQLKNVKNRQKNPFFVKNLGRN